MCFYLETDLEDSHIDKKRTLIDVLMSSKGFRETSKHASILAVVTLKENGIFVQVFTKKHGKLTIMP